MFRLHSRERDRHVWRNREPQIAGESLPRGRDTRVSNV